MIFDETTLRKLTRLTLVARQVRSGVMKGERRSTKRGTSIEFADYRNYSPGDDLRRLDWNVYARLNRPFMKLFEEEEDLAVHILIDASRSMDWGSEEQNKFSYALRLAAALGSIALAAGDRLTVAVMRGGSFSAQFGPSRSQTATLPLLQFLEEQKPSGVTDLYAGLRRYALEARRPGLLFLLSDLFSPSDITEGLAQLQGRGYEAVVLHLLSPDEIEPPLAGDLRLVDVETGHAQEVSLDGRMRDLYRQRVLAWRSGIQTGLRRRGVRFLALSTVQPWEGVVLQEMRRAGMVK